MSEYVLELAKSSHAPTPRSPSHVEESARWGEGGRRSGMDACEEQFTATANDSVSDARRRHWIDRYNIDTPDQSKNMRVGGDGETGAGRFQEGDGTEAGGGVASGASWDSKSDAQAQERKETAKPDEENMCETIDRAEPAGSKEDIKKQLMGMVERKAAEGKANTGRDNEQESADRGGDGKISQDWHRSTSREHDVSNKSQRRREDDWEANRESGGWREGKCERSMKGGRQHSGFDGARSISRERDMSRERGREKARQREWEERERETHRAREREVERERARERARERERERDDDEEYKSHRASQRRDSEDSSRFTLNLEAVGWEQSGRERKKLQDAGHGERQEMRSARGNSQRGGAELLSPRAGSLLSPRSRFSSQRSSYVQKDREQSLPSPPERS